MPVVEVICPGQGSGPLNALLTRSSQGLVYHVGYRTSDLAASLSALEAQPGLRIICVSPPKPAVLFNGEPVSFYMIAGIGMIEVIEGTGGYARPSAANPKFASYLPRVRLRTSGSKRH